MGGAVATLAIRRRADRAIRRLASKRSSAIEADTLTRRGRGGRYLWQPLRYRLRPRLDQSVALKVCSLQRGIARQCQFIELLQVIRSGNGSRREYDAENYCLSQHAIRQSKRRASGQGIYNPLLILKLLLQSADSVSADSVRGRLSGQCGRPASSG